MITVRVTLAELHVDPDKDWELSKLYSLSSDELEPLELTLKYAHIQGCVLCFHFDELPPGFSDVNTFDAAYRDAIAKLAAPLRHTLH